MNKRQKGLTSAGTFLGLVCGLVLTQQVVFADTNSPAEQNVQEVIHSTTNDAGTLADNAGASGEQQVATQSVVTNETTPTVDNNDNGNIVDANDAVHSTNNASVASASNDLSSEEAADISTTPAMSASGIWGTSAWDYTQNGNDSVLTFHAGTLGAGSINDATQFSNVGANKIKFDSDVIANADSSNLFAGLHNLRAIDGLANLDTSQVTDMHAMFYDCKNLTNLDLSDFDTSKVTNMAEMFEYCENLSDLNLGSFDTAQVTDMSQMFKYCSSLSNLNLSNFDTSQVTNMVAMFEHCSSLTSLDLSNFVTSKVQSMSYMFANCARLTNLNLANFDTSNIATFDHMFSESGNLASITVGPALQLTLEDNDHMAYQTVPGTDRKVMSNDWVAIDGDKQWHHYSTYVLNSLSKRDQVTTYQWDTGQSNAEEIKALTRTISIHQPDGQITVVMQSGKAERTVKYHSDGTVEYGDWSNDEFEAYQLPKISGYWVTKLHVPAEPISDFDQDQTVDIYYTPHKEKVAIKYIDESGQEVGKQTLNLYYGQTVHVNYKIPNGYDFVQTPQESITVDASGNQTINVYVTHQIAQTSESKTPMRLINVHYPDGSEKTVTQTAVIYREVYVDQVTGEKTYGAWSTGNFDKYIVPIVLGYTADSQNVASTSVDSDTPDVSQIDIYYSKNV
ncbi:BspA family leucine-rich repeat surface protein [Bombilactobacillus thymidiniphilus]|uniref:BspA family leucine-rich repeat surface protein n=1 Tax=Bombilactobacillus thymidiniphilus TaxID=2923363 RepID=A0ABY4PDT7_9LACO|nr:BspA family leucine-rich repeat surface protein [Bombilactobacillus thymidiniphilus]UQS83686.1 BspA family leucine-rich repeat surface protein [Bombilactobacillus thymidiniphilus]